MVQDLSALVTNRSDSLRCRRIMCEFDYASGRADLIGLGSNDFIHAFEAKLHRWRDALHQARRNTCFAHYCYVALPRRTAELALKSRGEFRRHGVGLVIVGAQHATIAIRPRRQAPLLPWLTKVALARISSGRLK